MLFNPSIWVKTNVVTPILLLLTTKLEEFKTAAIAALESRFDAKFDEWMPKVIQAIVVAMMHMAEKFGTGLADDVKNVIPGTVDDKFIDSSVKAIEGILGGLFKQ